MILINIGDELLLGQVINTNAAFIGQQMALAGIEMTECVTIGDDENAIRSAIENGFAKTNLIVVTGGDGTHRDQQPPGRRAGGLHRPEEHLGYCPRTLDRAGRQDPRRPSRRAVRDGKAYL